MLTRSHGRISFECDGCAEVLDAETKEFDESMQVLRGEMWSAEKVGDDWNHYCPGCAKVPRGRR